MDWSLLHHIVQRCEFEPLGCCHHLHFMITCSGWRFAGGGWRGSCSADSAFTESYADLDKLHIYCIILLSVGLN